MRIRNVNPRGQAFDVPSLGVTVEHGAEVDVDDETLAASLLEQDENWQPVSKDAKALVKNTDTASLATDVKE